MIVDARQLADGETVRSDICIIGAGAAGITIAREFIDQGIDVALVESGGIDFDPDTQELYKGEDVDSWYSGLEAMRLRFFGGSTNHWDGNCRPLDPIDFYKRPGIANSGWPFGRNELIPFYQRAEAVCELEPFDYSVVEWAGTESDGPLPVAREALVTGVYRRSPPTRFGTRYHDELRHAPNVTVYLHANVLQLETNDAATHVTGARVSTLQGKKVNLTANVFILATGGAENARLLLLSDETQSEGLGNANDLVGRYFSDHLNTSPGTIVPVDSGINIDAYDFRRRVYGFLSMPEELVRQEQLLNVTIALEAIAFPAAKGVTSAKRLSESLSAGEAPDQFFTDMGNMILDVDDVVVATWRKMIDRSAPIEKIRLHTRIEPAPNPENRVTLGQERDRFGQRRIRVKWRQGDLEYRSIKRAHELLALEAGRLALGRVTFSLDSLEGDMPDNTYQSFHHMGSTRMHESETQGVVDADCRIHQIDNLFIGGSSVFPTFGCSNPTFTIVALSLRLADHIKSANGIL